MNFAFQQLHHPIMMKQPTQPATQSNLAFDMTDITNSDRVEILRKWGSTIWL